MSWNGWAESVLKNGNQPTSDKAWITDQKGNLWGYCDKDGNQGQCPMSPEEFQAVTDLLQGKRNQADGLTIGGIHYIVLIADDDCIVCKKGASAGLTIAKAGQCIIFGQYDNSETTPGNNRLMVEKVRDMLKSNGY
ncbi:hypothetical protein C0Q70_21206 [Pomacea canaliculata]|uniref:Profilin n=1 Tax=Pomacea canaliculata TaxID=400727 RepID=A0A2T7NBV0_POMCA|nr:profilin-1-like [Pomacea canaliculata]PVD18656.1 hypothetical protein C0Q70_21206 [Pomacea canaliculata]